MKRRTFFGVVAGAVAGVFVKPKAKKHNWNIEDKCYIDAIAKDTSSYEIYVDVAKAGESSCNVKYYYIDKQGKSIEFEPQNGNYPANTYEVIWGPNQIKLT